MSYSNKSKLQACIFGYIQKTKENVCILCTGIKSFDLVNKNKRTMLKETSLQ